MKLNQMKLKSLLTGKIITVWPSTEHPNSSYGIPVWVDKNNNDYGQCDIWAVPLGFEKISLFEFTENQYRKFKTMLENMNKENWGNWDNRKWLKFPGLPGYAIHQYIQTNEKTFVVVKFDEVIKLPDNRKGKRFKVGGQRNYQPVCERF